MPHHIYQTTGFVIGSAAYAEADKVVQIFTEELGLVAAIGKSLRSEKSKLRYSLQDYSYARVDLVRGKEAWRVTDAEEIARISPNTPNDGPEKIKILAGVFSLLRRFVHGEERGDELFLTLREIFFFLLRENLSEEELKNLEIYSALKTLTLLGYAENGGTERMLSRETLGAFSSVRRKAIEKINKAIAESHL